MRPTQKLKLEEIIELLYKGTQDAMRFSHFDF